MMKRRRPIAGFKRLIVLRQRLTALSAQPLQRPPAIEPVELAQGELGRFRKLSDFQFDCQ